MENLTLNDLGAMVNVIDVCCERGAFKGSELSEIAKLRTNIENTLKAAAKKAEKEQDAEK